MVELLFYAQGEERLRAPLTGAPFQVGRAMDADIVIPDPAIPPRQFVIEQVDGKWLLKDLSEKGTIVDNAVVAETELSDGMEISLSSWRAVFSSTFPEEADQEDVSEASSDNSSGSTTPKLKLNTDSTQPVNLHIFTKGREERIVPFKGTAILGSSHTCTIKVEDYYVSRRHLKIERDGLTFYVKDINSKNGVYIGGALVPRATILLGCVVQIGDTELVFRRANKHNASYHSMVGRSLVMRQVYETIDRVAPHPALISIFGEPGTGKKLVAQAIHKQSTRYTGPFQAINCSAISPHMLESALFGHPRSVLPVADSSSKGAFLAASGGTLFLEEVADLPWSIQEKLVRAIDHGEIQQIGVDSLIRVDVRIVTATSKDLREEVKQGNFREDLYWRLQVVPIHIPPLRAHKSDLPTLIDYFLKTYAPHNKEFFVSPEAQQKLLEYDWPGNVRELKNTLNKIQLCRGNYIESNDIEFAFDNPQESASESEQRDLPVSEKDLEKEIINKNLEWVYIVGKKFSDIQAEVIQKALKRAGQIKLAAEELGLARATIYNFLDRRKDEEAGNS